MIRCVNWMDMPDNENVVELEPGDLIIREHSLGELKEIIEEYLHQLQYYPDRTYDTMQILNELMDQVKLINMQAEHMSSVGDL